MKPLITILASILLFLGCSQGVPPAVEKSVSIEAKTYLEYFVDGNYEKTVDLMDPRLSEREGFTEDERSQVKALVLSRVKEASREMNFISVSVGKPLKYIRSDKAEHVIIPYKAHFKYNGKAGIIYSHLLATRYFDGEVWYFCDFSTPKKDILKKHYPFLSGDIPDPRVEME
ncbi:MAG: hypothetical protein P8Y66_06025 [Nitrospirota bacterium]|jgi:hypothetical protein